MNLKCEKNQICIILLKVKAKSGTLVIKLKHNGAVWKKAIKQKFPGAINVNASKSSSKAKSRKIRSERGKLRNILFHLSRKG